MLSPQVWKCPNYANYAFKYVFLLLRVSLNHLKFIDLTRAGATVVDSDSCI